MFDTAPYAPPRHDGSEDITDVWVEETDPEHEHGEICVAHYDDNTRGYGCRCALVALTVTLGDGGYTCLTRHMAMMTLGPVAITRLERLRAARLEEGY